MCYKASVSGYVTLRDNVKKKLDSQESDNFASPCQRCQPSPCHGGRVTVSEIPNVQKCSGVQHIPLP